MAAGRPAMALSGGVKTVVEGGAEVGGVVGVEVLVVVEVGGGLVVVDGVSSFPQPARKRLATMIIATVKNNIFFILWRSKNGC